MEVSKKHISSTPPHYLWVRWIHNIHIRSTLNKRTTINTSDSAMTDMAPHFVLVTRGSAMESTRLDEVGWHEEQRVGTAIEDKEIGEERTTEEDIQLMGVKTPILGFLISPKKSSLSFHHIWFHHVLVPSHFDSIAFRLHHVSPHIPSELDGTNPSTLHPSF